MTNVEGPQGVRRIENVIKWSRVVNRYRMMNRKEVQPGDESSEGSQEDLPLDSVDDLQNEALLNGGPDNATQNITT